MVFHVGPEQGHHHNKAGDVGDESEDCRDAPCPAARRIYQHGTEFAFADGIGRVGFIASVSEPFCMNCNRIRLTADGKLRYCLFAIDEVDVRGALRNGGTDEDITQIIRGNVQAKWIGHEINNQRFVAPPRPMYAIGG